MAKPVAGRNGREPGRTTLACSHTAIVSCVFALEPEGATVVGLTEQVVFAATGKGIGDRRHCIYGFR
jgi:hypothetical protein